MRRSVPSIRLVNAGRVYEVNGGVREREREERGVGGKREKEFVDEEV